MKLGEYVKAQRNAVKVTQVGLAEKAGWDYPLSVNCSRAKKPCDWIK
ncbi:MAG: hypothetical protein ACTHK8_23055 [Ginsengibacter sp.]